MAPPPLQRPNHRPPSRNSDLKSKWLLGALAAIALLLAIPNIAAILMMATLGLGLPVLGAGAAFLYGLAALGGARLLGWTGRRSLRLLGGGLAVLAVATAPGALSRWQARVLEEKLRTADVARTLQPLAKTIELREPFISVMPAAPFESEPCGRECRALLMSGEVEWVRVVRQATQADLASATRFRMAAGAACPAAETGHGAAARCVLVAPDDGAPAALTVDATFLERAAFADYRSSAPLAPDLRYGRRLTATMHGAHDPVFVRTEASADVVTIPFLVWPASRGMSSGGYEIWRVRQTIAPLSLAQMFGALGYARSMELAKTLSQGSANIHDPPAPEVVNRAASALDLPANVAFNRTHLEFANRWIARVVWTKPLPPQGVALVRRILLEPRMAWFGALDRLLTRPEVAPTVLPDMLNLLETRKLTAANDATRLSLIALRGLSARLLDPHRARIMRIAAGHGPNADAMREIAQRLQ
ncbi:MAG: hypothetical protein KDJ25_03590 [Rhodoblastus sp.]|nr:hypothetical protein [Rhodoblastus sp.]